MKKVRVFDNFFKDPDFIREMAIQAEYQLISPGNYTGRDTMNRSIMFPELDRQIKKIFKGDHYKVICSRFRSAIDGDTHQTFVHADAETPNNGWHILIYLTKNKAKDGLVLYEHVDDGVISGWNENHVRDTENFEKFKPIECIPYKYNRAVVVDYAYFHAPMLHTGFGNCVRDSRLMMIIEICDTRTPYYIYRISKPGAAMATDDHPHRRQHNDTTLFSLEPLSDSGKGVEKLVD